MRLFLPKGKAILIACSGGIDSVVLLEECCKLRQLLKLSIQVAHVDHGLRKDSAKDADFVRKLAKRHKLKFHLKRLKPPNKQKINFESWGREKRYQFFAQVLKKHKLNLLLTAHNASDQAENLLMRLISNKEPRAITFFDKRRKLLRPFLYITKKEIISWARKSGYTWREDITNRSIEYLRNKVRLKLIPFLEKNFDARVQDVLSRRAALLGQDFEYFDELVSKKISKLAALKFGSSDWQNYFKKELKKSPSAIAWRLAAASLEKIIGYRPGYQASCDFIDFLSNNNRQRIQFSGQIALRRTKGFIRIIRSNFSNFRE